MQKQIKLGAIVSGVGKTAKEALDKSKEVAVKVIDRNGDGKIDIEDVSAAAGLVKGAVVNAAKAVKDTVSENNRQETEKDIQPVLIDNVDELDFYLPKMIRIAERDKIADEAFGKRAIGYFSEEKEVRLLTVFQDSVRALGLIFYPGVDSGLYYCDPSDKEHYIAIEEYFEYLKLVRVNELQKIAQDLGAKHFRVTYKEEQTDCTEKGLLVHAKVVAGAEFNRNTEAKKFDAVEIAGEMIFPGHEPYRPKLQYMQRDPSIQTLISMRMDEHSPLLHHKFMLKMSNSSGIKESDAVKIDAVINGLKCAGKFSVENEAKKESRRYLEYEIDF